MFQSRSATGRKTLAVSFDYEKAMNLNGLIGYLNTWSATQRFINENKFNPTKQLKKDLKYAWDDVDPEKKLIWKLILKVGRITSR